MSALMINMSQVQYPNDRVDISGKEHPTVGENIRNGSKNLTFSSQNERTKTLTSLNIRETTLKGFIIKLLTGEQAPWGGLIVTPLTDEERNSIKTWLNS